MASPIMPQSVAIRAGWIVGPHGGHFVFFFVVVNGTIVFRELAGRAIIYDPVVCLCLLPRLIGDERLDSMCLSHMT